MIHYQAAQRRAGRAEALAALSMVPEPDERAEETANLQRLVDLIDDKLPAAKVKRDFTAAEADAMTIIRHLERFERARYRREAVNGSLYGLSLGGVSTSSAACKVVLLRNWQRAARQRIEALS